MTMENESAMKCVLGGPQKNTRLGRNDAIVLNNIAKEIHRLNEKWWVDIETGEPKDRNVGEMLMLMVSEIAEALEGHRKSLMDNHLPHRRMFDVELADLAIRMFDLASVMVPEFGEIVVEKCEYNVVREDHQIENRRKENGKKY